MIDIINYLLRLAQIPGCKPEEIAGIKLRSLQLLTALYSLDNQQTRRMVKDITEVLDVGAIRKIMTNNAPVVLQEREEARLAALSLRERTEIAMQKFDDQAHGRHKEVSIYERLGYAAYIALARLEDYGVCC